MLSNSCELLSQSSVGPYPERGQNIAYVHITRILNSVVSRCAPSLVRLFANSQKFESHSRAATLNCSVMHYVIARPVQLAKTGSRTMEIKLKAGAVDTSAPRHCMSSITPRNGLFPAEIIELVSELSSMGLISPTLQPGCDRSPSKFPPNTY